MFSLFSRLVADLALFSDYYISSLYKYYIYLIYIYLFLALFIPLIAKQTKLQIKLFLLEKYNYENRNKTIILK